MTLNYIETFFDYTDLGNQFEDVLGVVTLGVPVVVKLTPYPLKGTMENMAEQLATMIRLKGLKRVGITQFCASMTDPKLVSLLHNGPCLLGPFYSPISSPTWAHLPPIPITNLSSTRDDRVKGKNCRQAYQRQNSKQRKYQVVVAALVDISADKGVHRSSDHVAERAEDAGS